MKNITRGLISFDLFVLPDLDGEETGNQSDGLHTKTRHSDDGRNRDVNYEPVITVLKAFILSILAMFSAGFNVLRGLPRYVSRSGFGKYFYSPSTRSTSAAMTKGIQYQDSENTRPFSCSAARFDPQKLRDVWGKPSFDVAKMTHLLDHDNHDKRAKFRKIFSEDPLMTPKYNISLDEERDLALKRLKTLCNQGFISVLDFKSNPHWIFAAHEMAAVVDAAMATKMTVQFNLFGGTVLKLGTERHHDKLLEVGTFYSFFDLVRVLLFGLISLTS